MTWLDWMVWAWGAWVLANFMLVTLAPLAFQPSQATCNGFTIIVPQAVRTALTEKELAAVLAHEQGHRAHWHVWKNFARVCVFRFPTMRTLTRYELQADDYAAERGHALELASALAKLSDHPADLARAQRLIHRYC